MKQNFTCYHIFFYRSNLCTTNKLSLFFSPRFQKLYFSDHMECQSCCFPLSFLPMLALNFPCSRIFLLDYGSAVMMVVILNLALEIFFSFFNSHQGNFFSFIRKKFVGNDGESKMACFLII